MIACTFANVTPDLFVSSLDNASIALWEKNSVHQCTGIPFRKLAYDSKFGVANSGYVVRSGGRPYLLSGHAGGYVLVWEILSASTSLKVVQTVDVRSPSPVPSPYPLRNVREIAEASDGIAVTGAEDGDICFGARSPVLSAEASK